MFRLRTALNTTLIPLLTLTAPMDQESKTTSKRKAAKIGTPTVT